MTRRTRILVGEIGARDGGLQGAEELEPRTLLATMFNPDGPTIATLPQTPSSVVTADFDGDGKQDLMLAVGREIRFQKGFGGGKFAAPTLVARLNTPAGLLGVGNFNDDGKPDLVSVQTGQARGWTRVLLNAGRAQMVVSAYNRPWTIVESIAVGNIDSDTQDEVLLEGRAPWLVLDSLKQPNIPVFGQPPDEVRVLDSEFQPQPLADNQLPQFASVRFVDRGVVYMGSRLSSPAIAPLAGGGVNMIVIGSQDPADVANGLVHVLSYVADAAPTLRAEAGLGTEAEIGGTAVGLLAEAQPPVSVQGVPTSVGVADLNSDFQTDLVVSTLTYPPESILDSFGSGDFTGQTLLLPRMGDAPLGYFGPAQTIHTRVLPGEGSGRRALVPEYRIASLADMNGDGRTDLGLSIVQEFFGGRTGDTREARFVQALQPGEGETAFASSTVALVFSDSLSAGAAFVRGRIFTAADVRGVGRPDLIFADRPGPLGAVKMKILYNVNAIPLIPYRA